MPLSEAQHRLQRRLKWVEFACVFAAVALLLPYAWPTAEWAAWGSRPAALGFLGVAILFPRLLAPLEWAWMKLAWLLGTVMGPIVLSLVFFGLLTPLAWLRKSLTKPRKPADTYWQAERKPYTAKSLEHPF